MGKYRNVTITLDKSLRPRLHGAADRAQSVVDAQVMKDTAPYVPMDSGHLSQDAVSNPAPGVIRWEGPYAANQYYNLPNKARDKHPLAVMRWFEAAKAANKTKWIRVAQKAGEAF